MFAGEYVIEPVHDQRGYRACEQLQKAVWGSADIDVVPDHMLHTIVEGGGLLLGAFDGVGPGRQMLGFVLSAVALWKGGKLRHQSHMLGVRPDWQERGVGLRLKCAQREHVLAQGIDIITWTFDPLESRNAHFNLNKLGAVVTQYLPNYYGDLRDMRNRGLPTDRFLCEWHLSSPRVEAHLEGKMAEVTLGRTEMINRTQLLPSGVREPAGFQGGLSAPNLFFEIPSDFQAIRRVNMELAHAWRLEARQALSLYFTDGYLVTGLFRQGNRSFLVLSRASLSEILSQP